MNALRSFSLLLLWTAACYADTPTASERVAGLVQQLAASSQAERAAAVQELETLGPAVLPLLPSNEAVSDAGIRDALANLRKSLEKQLALESTQAAQVTFAGEKAIDELLAEIERQTQDRIRLDNSIPVSPMSLSVKWDRTPFWTAVDEIGRATGRQPTWNSRRGWLLAVVEPDGRDAASAISGPFRVAIRDWGFKPLPGKMEQLLRVGFTVQAEPRLRPLFLAVRPGDWTASIGSMKLSAWNESAEYELPFAMNGCEVPWTLDLLAPAELPIDENWTLTGKCRVHLAAGTEPFVFEPSQWERGGTIRRGGVTVRLKSAQFANERRDLIVKLIVSYATGGPAFESHRIGMFQRAAHLETSDGKQIPFADFNVVAEADGGMALDFRFVNLSGDRDDYRFVYDAPTMLLDVPVQVELRIQEPRTK